MHEHDCRSRVSIVVAPDDLAVGEHAAVDTTPPMKDGRGAVGHDSERKQTRESEEVW
jgi:hypothetical protein